VPSTVAKSIAKAGKRSLAASSKPVRRDANSPPGRQHKSGKPDASQPPERALPVSLLRAREAVMLHMRPILRAHGFTEQQWRVLRSLDQSKPIDKTTLAARSTLLMPSLLRILKDLEQMGLLRSVPSISNPRLARIVLSAKGASAVEKGSRELAVMSQIVRDRIGGEIVDEILRLLHIVETKLL
jgi:homoprotocatechuate degradation regulator HpaR